MKWTTGFHFALLLASLQYCGGALHSIFFGTGSKDVIKSLEGLCQPNKAPTPSALAELQAATTKYVQYVDVELERFWKYESIFNIKSVKAGFDSNSLYDDLETVAASLTNCTPQSAFSSTTVYFELKKKIQNYIHELNDYFSYHVLAYGVEMLAEAQDGRSEYFNWSGISTIQFPKSYSDFENYIFQLYKKFSNLSVAMHYALVGRKYAACDSPRVTQMVFSAKKARLEKISQYHLLIASHLLELRTVFGTIKRYFSILETGYILETFSFFYQLETFLEDLLWLLFKYKRISDLELSAIDVSHINGKICVVDARYSIDMDDPTYYSSLLLVNLLKPYRSSEPVLTPERKRNIEDQMATFLDLFNTKFEWVEDLLVATPQRPDLIANELNIIENVAHHVSFALEDYARKEDISQLYDVLTLKTALKKALAYTLSTSARVIVNCAFDVYTGKSYLMRMDNMFKGTRRRPEESLRAYVCRLEGSLSFYGRFAEAFPLLFRIAHIVLDDFEHQLDPVAHCLANVPYDCELISPFMEMVGYKYLELMTIKSTINVSISDQPPESMCCHRAVTEKITKLATALLNLLQLLLRLQGASYSFLFNIDVAASSRELIIFNRTNRDEQYAFKRPFEKKMRGGRENLFRTDLGDTIEQFGPLDELFDEDRDNIYDLFALDKTKLREPLTRLESPLAYGLNMIYVRRAKILFWVLVICFILVAAISAYVLFFTSPDPELANEKPCSLASQ